MKNKILIATATYNESDNISKLIQKIIKVKLDLHILVIDDNSPDKTYLILKKFKKKIPKKFNFILRKEKLGLDTAHKEIYRFANKLLPSILNGFWGPSNLGVEQNLY